MVVDIDVNISSHLKEDLAWAANKSFGLLVLYIMLFKKQQEH